MKRALSLLLAAGMAFSLAACGGNTTSAEGSTTETDQGSASGSDKVWVIATDTVFKPFEYTDANGQFVGIDVDIVHAIAEDQGFEYKINSLGWDGDRSLPGRPGGRHDRWRFHHGRAY